MGQTVPKNCFLKYGGRNKSDALFMDQDNWGHIASSTTSIQPRLQGIISRSFFPSQIKYRPFNAIRAILFNSQEIALA